MYYYVDIWLDNCALYLQMSWSDMLRTRYDIQDITKNFQKILCYEYSVNDEYIRFQT